jgi:hypothetical protein
MLNGDFNLTKAALATKESSNDDDDEGASLGDESEAEGALGLEPRRRRHLKGSRRFPD